MQTKLVLTRNVSPRNSPIKMGKRSSERISRIGLYIEPTRQEREFGWTENLKDLPTIIRGFLKTSVPAETYLYGLLVFPSEVEYSEMLDEFRKEARPAITGDAPTSKTDRLLHWLLNNRRSFTIRTADLTAERAARLYENYNDWRMLPYTFLISTRRHDNWPDVVGSLQYPKLVTEDLLKKYGNLLTNIYEHGVELIGLDISLAEFKSLALSLSEKLRAEFEFREQPTPH